MTTLAAAARVLSRQALDDAVAGQHASVDRKVATDHKGTHGSVLLSKNVRLVGEIRLVLAAVDQDKTSVAAVVPVALVHGVCPSSTPAEALEILHVETAHCDFLCGGVHRAAPELRGRGRLRLKEDGAEKWKPSL